MAQGYLVGTAQQMTDAAGLPAVGWQIGTYTATGTFATPLVTYSDAALTSLNTNPIVVDGSGSWRAFVGAGVSLDLKVLNADNEPQYTLLSQMPTTVYDPLSNYTRTGATDTAGTYAGATLTSPTLTSPTLSSITDSDVKVLAADATATSNATLASLTGFSWTLVAAGTYAFRVRGKVGMTTNGGLALAFKYTTLTLTSIVVNASQRTASAFALAQSTTTTDQTKFIDQKAVVYLDVELQGSLVVNAGGTLAVQFAQNTSHSDTTTVYKGFMAEFVRTS